jgi:hypothetical protein
VAVQIVGYVQGEQDYGDARLDFCDLLGRLKAVHDGHGDVHNDYVGTKLKCFFHRLLPVAGLRAYTPTRLELKQIANSHSHDFVIVRDQNANPGMRRTVDRRCSGYAHAFESVSLSAQPSVPNEDQSAAFVVGALCRSHKLARVMFCECVSVPAELFQRNGPAVQVTGTKVLR